MTVASVSVRLVWPFARAMGDYKAELSMLRGLGGLEGEGLADPEARITVPALDRLLSLSLARTGDPTLGLRAGTRIEPGDFGIVEAAARSATNLGAALRVFGRYVGLLDQGMRAELRVEGGHAHWRLHQIGREPIAASNDFQVRAALSLGHAWLGLQAPPHAVHFCHDRPAYADAYGAYFGCPVYFGQDANALIFDRRAEALPLVGSHADLFEAFEARAAQQLAARPHGRGVAERVEQEVLSLLPHGPANMPAVARRLNMSVATLRRRLAEEGRTHQQILADVRLREATRCLRDGRLSISQIAFALGFAAPQVFCRAFRRWTGKSPAEYRRFALADGGGG